MLIKPKRNVLDVIKIAKLVKWFPEQIVNHVTKINICLVQVVLLIAKLRILIIIIIFKIINVLNVLLDVWNVMEHLLPNVRNAKPTFIFIYPKPVVDKIVLLVIGKMLLILLIPNVLCVLLLV